MESDTSATDGWKIILPLNKDLVSFEKIPTRPKSGFMSQIYRTENFKCKAISSICNNKLQTSCVSRETFSLLVTQNSRVMTIAWSCTQKKIRLRQTSNYLLLGFRHPITNHFWHKPSLKHTRKSNHWQNFKCF